MNENDIRFRQLLEDIEKYFDCGLTDDEERDLRRRIAAEPIAHPSVDEARALMGFAPGRRKRHRPIAGQGKAAIAGIAAAVAVLLVLGLRLYSHVGQVPTSPVCTAYSGGKVITDEDAVLALMNESLFELNDGAHDAGRDMIDDIGLIAPAVDRYVTNYDPVKELL